ncbi:MAG: ComEA family DNA-binding protein [Pyrinomonadaceae bacterium]
MRKASQSARSFSHSLLAGLLVLASAACGRLPRQYLSEHPSPRVASAKSSTRVDSTSARININSASAQELEKLPGVGRVVAARIVAHRQEHGSFRRVEHLLLVRGISDRKFREIRSLVTVE